MILPVKEHKTLATNIGYLLTQVERIRKQEDPESKTKYNVLLLSKQNELRLFESALEDTAVRWVNGRQIMTLTHLNIDKLTPQIARGETRIAVIISKQLWGANIETEPGHTKSLHNSLITSAHTLGLQVSDLVHYV